MVVPTNDPVCTIAIVLGLARYIKFIFGYIDRVLYGYIRSETWSNLPHALPQERPGSL